MGISTGAVKDSFGHIISGATIIVTIYGDGTFIDDSHGMHYSGTFSSPINASGTTNAEGKFSGTFTPESAGPVTITLTASFGTDTKELHDSISLDVSL